MIEVSEFAVSAGKCPQLTGPKITVKGPSRHEGRWKGLQVGGRYRNGNTDPYQEHSILRRSHLPEVRAVKGEPQHPAKLCAPARAESTAAAIEATRSQEIHQGLHRLLRSFFHQPMSSPLKDDHGYVGRNQLHLCIQGCCTGFLAGDG